MVSIERADKRLMKDYAQAIETIHNLTEKLNKLTDEYSDFRIKYDEMQDDLFESCRLLNNSNYADRAYFSSQTTWERDKEALLRRVSARNGHN